MNIKYNRKDHMSKKCTHREFYAQFITPLVKDLVRRLIGKKSILRSTDEHLNDIALSRWDSLHTPIRQIVGKMVREANGNSGHSLSDSVCVAKEAAKQIKEDV